MYPDHGSIEQLQMPNRTSSSNNNNNNNNNDEDQTTTNSGKRRIFNVFKNHMDTKIHYKFMKKEK
jgi:hypothetical protein